MATDSPHQDDPEDNIRNFLECPICYVSYDNVFKTPLLLPCSHTFCMECISRLCLFLKKSQEFPCPFCRSLAQIPPEGVPKMQPNLDIVAQLPPEMQTLHEVWLAGYKLCSMKKKDSSEGRTSLMTINILSTDHQVAPGPDGLINMDRHGCRSFCRSIWGMVFMMFAIAAVLFLVLFLPIYISRKD